MIDRNVPDPSLEIVNFPKEQLLYFIGCVDNMRMRQITNKHAADITKIFQILVSKEALIQDRQGRWARYSIPQGEDSAHSNIHSAHKDVDSAHSTLNHSAHKSQLSNIQLDMLIQIADPAKQNKKLPSKEMEQIILSLCRGHWLTGRQLGDLLARSSSGLRYRFLILAWWILSYFGYCIQTSQIEGISLIQFLNAVGFSGY